MYKTILQSIDNVAIWPILSFVIFFLFFIALLLHVFTTGKDFIEYMKNIPMDDTSNESKTSSHEK